MTGGERGFRIRIRKIRACVVLVITAPLSRGREIRKCIPADLERPLRIARVSDLYVAGDKVSLRIIV